MTSRTFKQYGQGYGPSSVNVTVKLDSQTVFSGPVETIDQPVEWKTQGIEVYTFSIPDLTFEGSLPLEISVTGGDFFLASTNANYCKIVLQKDGKPEIYSSGPNGFQLFYFQEANGIIYSDPLTNEMINGVPQEGPPNPEYTGQWGWIIPNGSTFTADLNILAGVESPLVPPAAP